MAASNGSGRRGQTANGSGRPAPVYRPPGADRRVLLLPGRVQDVKQAGLVVDRYLVRVRVRVRMRVRA